MIQISDMDAGLASRQDEEFTHSELFTGDTPVTTTPETVLAAVVTAAALPALTPVGRNASGLLIVAVQADATGPVNAIGLTTAEVLQGDLSPQVAIYRSGMFNPDLINWPASYDTDEKKRTAFDNSDAKGIFIRKPEFS